MATVIVNQLARDVKIAAEIAFAAIILSVEGSAMFGVMYYFTAV